MVQDNEQEAGSKEQGEPLRWEFSPSASEAFAPGRLLVGGGAEGLERAFVALTESLGISSKSLRRDRLSDQVSLLRMVGLDVARAVVELRDRGLKAEPDHVLFAHGGACGCCGCGGPGGPGGVGGNPVWAAAAGHGGGGVGASGLAANPVWASPVWASPVWASSVAGNPVWASPVWASPVWASPVWASPVWAARYRTHGSRPTTAVPTEPRAREKIALPTGPQRVVVLDTGIARPDLLPSDLASISTHAAAPAADHEVPDTDGNLLIDPAAGHGTFISGIIEQLAPKRVVNSYQVLSPVGDTRVSDIVIRIDSLIASGAFDEHTVINMSFGGFADEEMFTLAAAIRRVQDTGAVVVASAGNDGVCTPTYPACLPGVVGVASIEPGGPAPYSNFGSWVSACAPGTDVVSMFFDPADGALAPISPAHLDPDQFAGWAKWTGTSFAAPIVVAALIRHMAITGETATEAVAHVIDDPVLFRIPNYGTVINLALGA